MSSQRDTIIHLVAGGIAGTTGAVVTCPLEVVKTRLQSSNPVFGSDAVHPRPPHYNNGVINSSTRHGSSYRSYHGSSAPGSQLTPPKLTPGKSANGQQRPFSTGGSCGRSAQYLQLHHSSPMGAGVGGGHSVGAPRIGLIQCLRLIIEKEGPGALFKGLGPNLVGVAPSRAIYFCAYSQSKKTYNQMFPADSPIVHIFSAATAGFVACTTTNPVWFVKTRLQLDQQRGLTARQTIRRIYTQGGILGFYKGISASYMGISETVIHFVIYEAVKKRLQEWSHSSRASALAAASSCADDEDQDYGSCDDKTSKDFLQFMAAGAFSKTVASCIAYPHEVARTRLREEGNKYHHLIQTLTLVAKEEGYRGLYRGLATQLIRQIPNTAIMMSTYEAAVYLLTKYTPTSFSSNMGPTNVLDNASSGNNYDETYFAESAHEGDSHPQQRRLTV